MSSASPSPLPQSGIEPQMKADPDFRPAVLPSESDVVHRYAQDTKPIPSAAAVPAFDKRLRPFGSLAIVVWIGALTVAAVVREIRRKHA